MEGEHQACFAGTKMEPALIGSGLALGFATAEPRLCAAPRSGRHGNQWEEEGEDERFNNIDQSGRWAKKAAEGMVRGYDIIGMFKPTNHKNLGAP